MSFLQVLPGGDTLVSCYSMEPDQCELHGTHHRVDVVHMSQSTAEYTLTDVRVEDSSEYLLQLSGPTQASRTALLNVYSPKDLVADLSIENKDVPWNTTYKHTGCCDSVSLLIQTRQDRPADIHISRGSEVTSCTNTTTCTYIYRVEDGRISVLVDYSVCQPFSAYIIIEAAGGGLGPGEIIGIILGVFIILLLVILVLLVILQKYDKIPESLKFVETPLNKAVGWSGLLRMSPTVSVESGIEPDHPGEPVSPVTEAVPMLQGLTIHDEGSPQKDQYEAKTKNTFDYKAPLSMQPHREPRHACGDSDDETEIPTKQPTSSIAAGKPLIQPARFNVPTSSQTPSSILVVEPSLPPIPYILPGYISQPDTATSHQCTDDNHSDNSGESL